ncbi:developmentally-regulated protein [Acrasis kona]|uniref:Developmentally-regulated protein n=1 Tax=Acrasis kona TaxID=1008807 RepID=A0AAW2ZP00_9EUKA
MRIWVFYYNNGKTLVYSGVESKECQVFELNFLPSVEELKYALDNAELVWEGDGQEPEFLDEKVTRCAKQGSSIWHANSNDKEYAVCVKKVNGSLVPSKIISPEFIADFTKEPTRPIDLEAQLLRIEAKCPKSPQDEVPPVNNGPQRRKKSGTQPWFKNHSKSCRLGFRRDDKSCARIEGANGVENTTATKDCVFIHGAGVYGNGSIEEGSFYGYWGNVHLYTPQCKNRYYFNADTIQNGWDSESLQKLACDTILYKSDSKDKVARDRVIFSHSMGNLILGAAIHKGLCDIDVSTTSWYSIMAPWRGSQAANWVGQVCSVSGLTNYLLRKGASALGYCDKGMKPCHAYETLIVDNPALLVVAETAKSRVKGLMCGVAPWGLTTTYSPLLRSLSSVVGFPDDNDGMVGISSCNVNKYDFTNDPHSKYYATYTNHADGTCRNGNGWMRSGEPCNFYTDKL